MLVTEQLMIPIDFHSVFSPYNASQWVPSALRLSTFLKIYFKECMKFFIQLNTKEDILKNVGNRTVDDSHWLP